MAADEEHESWREIWKELSLLWMALSLCLLIGSYIWQGVDPDSENRSISSSVLKLCSWMSLLLSIGYRSTPTGSWHGKVAFGGVTIMVIGICFKLFHLPAANALIIIGIIIVAGMYALIWKKDRASKQE